MKLKTRVYYFWWKVKATSRLIERWNYEPYQAWLLVRKVTSEIQPYIWVPSDPEEFIDDYQTRW